MKTIHIAITAGSVIALSMLLFFVAIYSYNSSQNISGPVGAMSSTKPLFANIVTEPEIVTIGNSFQIYATVNNTNPWPIVFYDGCVSPLTMSFDKNVQIQNEIGCNAISSETINPGEQVRVHGPRTGLVYNTTAIGTTNATIVFSYQAQGNSYNVTSYKQIAIEPLVSPPSNLAEQLRLARIGLHPTNEIHYYDSSNLNPKVSLYDYSYDGIDKDGLVLIDNQTFYQTTLDNDIYKLKGVSLQFHNVTFSFPEGTLATPGGAFVNLDVKFQDGFEEIYGGTMSNPDGSGTMIGGISIPTKYGPHLAANSITVLGNHAMPQAGLTIYQDKVKLLVSSGNQVSFLSNEIKKGSDVTNDTTYLSQTVDEWKNKTPEQLDAYYKKYKDAFYTELGSFLIKDEMKKELERQKIQNMHDDFKVFPGMTLDSLPPQISYDAVVNATDGNSYLLLGGVSANKAENVTIKKLVFDKDVLNSLSTGKKPSFVNPFAKAPKVVISGKSGTNPVVEPFDLALDLDKGNLVTFYNNLTVPIRIQPYGSGLVVDEGGLGWKSKIIGPNELLAIQFNKTGYYEWNARSPPQGSENWWDFEGSGQIAAFSQNHDDSTSGDKLKIAQIFVADSDIPWSSTGLDNYGDLEIGLYESVYHMIPDAQKYYLSRAMQLIPFEVPVIIASPSFTEK